MIDNSFRDVTDARYLYGYPVHKVAQLREYRNPHGARMHSVITRCGIEAQAMGDCRHDSPMSHVRKAEWCKACAPNGR
ncbi:hypothetical protein [Nocardia sp. NBC_01327]|uniref:hypothetical protein n=1 Tax=Nocardia sp. NBC_01327 TaxID=2903593 RepID=UPI002E0F6D88|nr:hypothetical protein OG326_42395 [Nocardia sp. NBC_01327]